MASTKLESCRILLEPGTISEMAYALRAADCLQKGAWEALVIFFKAPCLLAE